MIKKPKSIIKSKLPIILASKSETRKKMLLQTGIIFKQVTSKIDEEEIKRTMKVKNINNLAKRLAELKALDVSKKNKGAYVIGADQICVGQNIIFSKPKHKEKALKQLIKLNGRIHKQVSAICICYNKKILWSYTEVAKMKMRKLSIASLKRYIECDLPLNSCGSYKFEANGKYLFSKIEGNTSTIMGLPLLPLLNELHKNNVISYV